jgi:hypothetical protein
MAFRQKYDIAIIVMLVLTALAYASFTSEFRLKENMPTEFFDPSQLPRAKRTPEEKIAKAYWACAVKQVQWKYGYASRLPDDPPPEFGLSSTDVGSVAKDEVTRRHYWQQLRSVWHVQTAWSNEYVWSSISFRQSLRRAGDWWGQETRNLLGQ